MPDFTLKSYKTLLLALQQAGYQFQTFETFLSSPQEEKTVILRHDVDELASNALAMAKLEHTLGIRATYYFRIVKQSNVPEIIRQIAAWGHEIGYHYETLAAAEGDMDQAIASFEENLAYFRTYYPVRTVCMHGSSSSQHDNRLIWSHRRLSDYGLIGEPYLTLDFNKVYYLSDTGYAWDGGKYAVRDKVDNPFGLHFHSTREVVCSIHHGEFPHQAMILAHTLWTSNPFLWCWLHARESLRNSIKQASRNNKTIAKIYKALVDIYWKASQGKKVQKKLSSTQ